MSTTQPITGTINKSRLTGESLRKEIKEMWREAFKVTPEWLDMYFKKVYHQSDLLTIMATDDDDIIAGSLLMQRYNMYFHSTPIPVAYISGATTRREYRDRGYMKQLMRDALAASYERGDVLMTLIPADRHLYFYYDRFGFSTVFYIDEERYTQKHIFPFTQEYEVVNPADNHDVFQFVDSMLRKRNNVMLHTYEDFQNIISDALLDGGSTTALRNVATGKIESMVIAAPDNERVTVKELLSSTDDARNAALAHVRTLFPGHPLTVISPADSRSIPIHARGMARIINARKLLSAYAAHYPKLSTTIKLYDPLLPQNNHIYIIDGGEAIINDGFGGKIELDVTQEILLSIICSDAPIGDIFNLPTARPYISMMMD